MDKRAKIILPGGAGLVGQNLVPHLKQAGFSNLTVLDKHGPNLDILKKMHPDITTVQADLAELGAWTDHFANAGAVVMLQAQIGDLEETPFIRNNVTSTEHVLAAIDQHAVPYCVHISSSVVLSLADDFYTRSKRAQEELFLASGVKGVVLRPTLMFGWFDRKHLGWLSRWMQKIPVFPIPGNGRYMRQPLYVGDFCRIIVNCLTRSMIGGPYNISGLERVDYVDLICNIKHALGASTRIVHIPYFVFDLLLRTWALFDKHPPFTSQQLKALVAGDEFEVIDWPQLFQVIPTPLKDALYETFQDPTYGSIALEF